jgi:hypothetical protein
VRSPLSTQNSPVGRGGGVEELLKEWFHSQ